MRLLDLEAYPLFLKYAAAASFESVKHHDLLQAWKIRDVKLAQKEELAAIRSHAIRPKKRKVPSLTHRFARKERIGFLAIAGLILDVVDDRTFAVREASCGYVLQR